MIGTLKISYGRLIQLLMQKRVKRVYLLADGQVAIVEASKHPFSWDLLTAMSRCHSRHTLQTTELVSSMIRMTGGVWPSFSHEAG